MFIVLYLKYIWEKCSVLDNWAVLKDEAYLGAFS